MYRQFVHPLFLLVAFLLFAAGCERNRNADGNQNRQQAEPLLPANAQALEPTFDGPDEGREKTAVRLEPVAGGYGTVTDIQFVPDSPGLMIVLQKEGEARWVDLNAGEQGVLLEIDVKTDVEEGLLGLAFHPDYEENGKFYLNYVVEVMGKDVSRVGEWQMNGDPKAGKAKENRVIMVLEQPRPNHNAGQLQFGPDGYLYVGWGDGGGAGDPFDAGQDPSTMLGSMLRIDVDRPDEENDKPYGIPEDNPFVGREGFLPETWAYGFRNPWRYSFAPDGRLILNDVGQNSWEEVNIVASGRNYGWNIREGRHCYEPPEGCPSEGLTNPIYEYEWGEEGQSTTGGYVYLGDAIPALKNKYVFGDYVSGRIWAIDLPPADVVEYAEQKIEAVALGKFPLRITTFGRDASGEVYVGNASKGIVYRIAAGE